MADRLTLNIEKHGEWFIGSCSQIPGANGQGQSEEECRVSLLQAISLLAEDEYKNSASASTRQTASIKGIAPVEYSQLAELHVAGLKAEAGWRIYFPHRDDGFDFIATKAVDGWMIIRPVQVKGKYPTASKLDKVTYGFIGKLSQTHLQMILAIPYFEVGEIPLIRHVAFMPYCMLRPHTKGWRCQPAKLVGGSARIRGDHKKFFDQSGLARLESGNWANESLAPGST